MNEISAMSSSAISLMQARVQEQISMSFLKANVQAAQAMADVLTQNARKIEVISENTSGKSINILV